MVIILVIQLVIAFICGFAGYAIAKGKGRDPMFGAIIGFFIGPIGLIIIALLPPANTDRRGRYAPRGGYGRDRGGRRGGPRSARGGGARPARRTAGRAPARGARGARPERRPRRY